MKYINALHSGIIFQVRSVGLRLVHMIMSRTYHRKIMAQYWGIIYRHATDSRLFRIYLFGPQTFTQELLEFNNRSLPFFPLIIILDI